jgi:DNA polymerase-1
LLVVDGHAYAYRAFYAIRDLRSPAGEAVNGIYGFVKMLGKLRAGLQPTHVVVVWDGGMDGERLAALPEYKAHRPEMPSDLAEQIDGMMEFLGAAGVASVCIDGVEADDWIGCVARAAEQAGWEVVIASADKDFLQLVSLESETAGLGQGEARPPAGREAAGWIGLVNPNDKSERIWGKAEVRSKTGVEPAQVLDWLSLLGDAVDGIPGVPGVGTKTATGLLNGFGSVDGIYARLGEVKPERIREGLRAAEKDVRRNQGLVALKRVPGFEFVPEDLVVKPVAVERLTELYRHWGFRGLLAEFEKGAAGGAELDVRERGQRDLF